MEPKKVRQIFLLLDSEQPGEQSAALSRLRALKAQGEPVIRDVFDLFDKVAEVAEERDKLKQENVTLAARVRLGRPSLWRTIKTHARTSAISAGVVVVLGGGFHFVDLSQRDAQGAALRLELQHRLDRALAELAMQREARPPVSPSSPPAKDRRK
jgi:hypothetical protein